ncbi:MAG: DUF2914 domain-containing protein [Gammaproteobacteria bacterium]
MRHHRRRTRGLDYRLTRIVAVVTLAVWGGLLLAAMFNYNKPPSSDKAQQATRSESGQRVIARSDQEPVRVAGHNNDEQRARDGSSSDEPAAIAIAGSPTATAPETPPLAVRSDASAEPQTSAARPALETAEANATIESDMARFEMAPEEPEVSTSVSSDHVARAQFTTRIDAREPVDRVGAVFPSNGQSLRTLFYFTEITGLNGETVTHRWEHEGQVVAEVSFDIGSDRWRAYSSKDLNQGMKGNWRVVVTDSKGEIIKTDSFAYDES